MLVSVLVANHNYGRYVAAAIDSALGQTHREVEVVVVDDGSTDDSRDVIRSYGDRIVAVFQPQGGQTTALNAAFERSRGDLICLLDADDVFRPTKVERVVAAWRGCPAACLIHHQMQIIDAEGRPRHKPFPRRVPQGDLSGRVARSGGWFPHAPTSALSFPRAYARRLFPVPSDLREVPTSAGAVRVGVFVDTYLAGPAAMIAPVAAIAEPLACYRIHGANRIATDAVAVRHNAERTARQIVEVDALVRVLGEVFGRQVTLRMRDHLEYQLARCAAAEISRAQAVASVLRSPGLPAAAKPREAVRVLANRGPAARI